MKRVVITGLGPVTPIGCGKETFWNALEEGKNGVDYITAFDTTDHNVKFAGEVKDFNAEDWLDRKEARRTDRVLHLVTAAADLAVKDSKLNLDEIDKQRFGVYIGSGEGGIATLEENFRRLYKSGPTRVSPFMVPMMITNMPAAYVAIRYGAKGPNFGVVSACASSINSMGEAYHCIARGDADIMLTGGTEAAVTVMASAGFATLKALSSRNDDPKHASRPFDKDRDGFVIAEGSGVLMFEELEHAKKRGAHIYGEIKGYGITCDAYHITAPDPDGEGAYRAMKMAVDKAGWSVSEIDLINAHGTSTPLNDSMESSAIKMLLGDNVDKTYVHSTKSMMGHALGAAGSIEMIASLMAIDRGIVHPTINQFESDPECNINIVKNQAIKADVSKILNNNFGFGGHNAVLAVERYTD